MVALTLLIVNDSPWPNQGKTLWVDQTERPVAVIISDAVPNHEIESTGNFQAGSIFSFDFSKNQWPPPCRRAGRKAAPPEEAQDNHRRPGRAGCSKAPSPLFRREAARESGSAPRPALRSGGSAPLAAGSKPAAERPKGESSTGWRRFALGAVGRRAAAGAT